MKKILIFILFTLISKNVFADFICDSTATRYSIVYEPNEYFCEQGQFLPANTVGCVACPENQICPGGTYSFNPKLFQGLELVSFSGELNNACDDSWTDRFAAVYEPNIIEINWNDGINITQTQCVYDTLIEYPADPVRPGYKFMGWRVKLSD